MGDLTVFSVTDMGLQIDGRMVMPGSRLLIKGAPHTGWNGCGVVVGDTGEQSLQVASPRAVWSSILRTSPQSQRKVISAPLLWFGTANSTSG